MARSVLVCSVVMRSCVVFGSNLLEWYFWVVIADVVQYGPGEYAIF